MRGMTRVAYAGTIPAAALAAAMLCACTAAPPAPALPGGDAARYRCDHGIAFTVRPGADSVTIDAGPRGRELLLRDAGGVTPRQTVYSSTSLKAEFGLGAAGNEAVLRYAEPPLVAHCVRE